MNSFNREYLFILQPEDECLPSLTPDKDTALKPYDWEMLSPEEKPPTFFNGGYEMQKRKKVTPIDPVPDILFSGNSLLVVTAIADKLRDLNIKNLAIQPAIYIDHKNNHHDNYWLLTFTKSLECMNRQGPSTFVYSLNESALNKKPLVERRFFKTGRRTETFIVVHESIAEIFRVNGVDVISVADYGIYYP
jgi:hypothetical protein